MKRRLIIVLLAMILVISSTVPVSASGSELNDGIIVSPMFTYIATAQAQIHINSSGKATAYTDIFGNSSVTRVVVAIKLQQLRSDGVWITIRSWSDSSNSRSLYLNGTHNVPKGHYYRVQSVVTAYSGSKSETTTLTTSSQKY